MTHEEQRIWLIEQLLAERSDVSDVKIPSEEQEQKNLLRGLMNIRMPEPISDKFLKVQDEYCRFAKKVLPKLKNNCTLPSPIKKRRS